jgi:hypothetical protein
MSEPVYIFSGESPLSWYTCNLCGETFPVHNNHYCRRTIPATPGCQPLPPLTEERVRQIVREELAKIKGSGNG